MADEMSTLVYKTMNAVKNEYENAWELIDQRFDYEDFERLEEAVLEVVKTRRLEVLLTVGGPYVAIEIDLNAYDEIECVTLIARYGTAYGREKIPSGHAVYRTAEHFVNQMLEYESYATAEGSR